MQSFPSSLSLLSIKWLLFIKTKMRKKSVFIKKFETLMDKVEEARKIRAVVKFLC
jgi:hypothetical protein